MCGIVGAISTKNCLSFLLEGLQRLEYRGYDSAGVAVLDQQQALQRCRVLGKVNVLRHAIDQHMPPINGLLGIAHTRWATHGAPEQRNAHPHVSGPIALVHNGIIENYQVLTELLRQQGYTFTSDTDSEVIAHLIHDNLIKNKNNPNSDFNSNSNSNLNHADILAAVQTTIQQLTGAYGLAIINQHQPDQLIAVRQGSPLVLGLGQQGHYVASDPTALLSVAEQFIFLQDGDIAVLDQQQVTIYDSEARVVKRPVERLALHYQSADKGEFKHYMQKEIFEQVTAIQATLAPCLVNNTISSECLGPEAQAILPQVKHIQICACGTSYHAGMVARYWLETLAQLPCSVEIASELRYRQAVIPKDSLFICISQSGETADTLAALNQAKQLGYLATMVISNVPASSLVRAADFVLMTQAGSEIAVASTKAFTTQLAALFVFTLMLAKAHRQHNSSIQMTGELEAELCHALVQLPEKVADVLAQLAQPMADLAQQFDTVAHSLFLGRGVQYPVALEGALKLKEISYIHAEAYPAGELKHGPLALVDAQMPVIVLAPNDALLDKLKANMAEVSSRGAELIVFTQESSGLVTQDKMKLYYLPEINSLLTPIVFTIPLQLLAYQVALCKGTDVDQPRNLAKSVTVE